MFLVTHLMGLPLLLSKNNIQQVFQKFHVLLKEEFSPEDVQIIACPSMEQVIHHLKILVLLFLFVILLEQVMSLSNHVFNFNFKNLHNFILMSNNSNFELLSQIFRDDFIIFNCFFKSFLVLKIAVFNMNELFVKSSNNGVYDAE